jgi:hypothetical protein
VRPGSFYRCLVAAAGLALFGTSCSATHATNVVTVKPTTNSGLCKLVSPSVIATVLNTSMTFPETLVRDSTTECVYRSKQGTDAAVLIRYDTGSNAATFTRTEQDFERRGLKLGPITQLGDEAYYFSEPAGHATVTTVVARTGSRQLLITGAGTLDQIGSIARYALSQFETTHASAGP